MTEIEDPNDVGWMATPSALKIDYVKRYAVGTTALDLGCGRGWYAGVLADMGLQVTGMDQVNRITDTRITVLKQSIGAPLPFEDKAFDTVLMFDILEHLPDESAILSEVARVCKSRLILSVPHADAGSLTIYGMTYLHYEDDTHLREYLPEGLCATLEAHGFNTVHLALEGKQTFPLFFSEFIRGGRIIKRTARYLISALYKIGLVYNDSIASDIFYVGERTE